MVGTATKYYFGISLLLMGAATVFGIGTGADSAGNVAFIGTAILGTTALSAAFLAFMSMEVGDGPSPDRQRESTYELVPTYWPVMMSVGIGVLGVGLVINTQLAILGLFVMIAATIEWTLSAWADHRSTDVAANYAQRRVIATPFEVPLYGSLAIAVPVYLISRVLLAVSPAAASLIALGASVVILVGAFGLYAFPDMRKALVTSMLALSATALIVGGVVAAAIGEREIEPHGVGTSSHDLESDATEDGLGQTVSVVEVSR